MGVDTRNIGTHVKHCRADHSGIQEITMAKKKTYIYHMLIGNYGDYEVDTFMFARNACVAIEYCKELYKDKKYNSYKAIKVGVSHYLRNTQMVSPEDEEKLRNSIASQGDEYREIEVEAPAFITKEEAGDLEL